MDVVFLLCVKEYYIWLLLDYLCFEIVESFFNFVYCWLFDYCLFIFEWFFIFSFQLECCFCIIFCLLVKDFYFDYGWEFLLMCVISDLLLCLCWQNKSCDIYYIICYLMEMLGIDNFVESYLQVVNELFYCNKVVWLVGKLIIFFGILLFLLLIYQMDDGELFIDICLMMIVEVSIVFGFVCFYFMVYVLLFVVLVEWLWEILLGKIIVELYMVIGCQKYVKIESYCEYFVYLQGCNEQFIEVLGICGMVMLVFMLLGFDWVFKVIKDRFVLQKEMFVVYVCVCY